MPRSGVSRKGVLDPHRNFLDQRWREGSSNAVQLWRELVTRGFGGRPSTVRAWAGAHRRALPASEPSGSAKATPQWQLPSRRGLARLLMAQPATLAVVEGVFMEVLLSAQPHLAEALAVARRLRSVLLWEVDEDVDPVLADAEATPTAGFVTSMRRDIDAILAALSSSWTTSPVEGQINRLKTIKRSMYGRASFTLLRARVLHAA
jgi:transposase